MLMPYLRVGGTVYRVHANPERLEHPFWIVQVRTGIGSSGWKQTGITDRTRAEALRAAVGSVIRAVRITRYP